VARKPRTRAAKQISKDRNADFLAIKRDLTGSVVFNTGAPIGTGTIAGTGTSTFTTGRDLLAAQVAVSLIAGTSATGTVSLNGTSIGTFTGTGATVSTLPDTVQTPINSVTVAVTTTAGGASVSISALPESRIF